MSAELRAIAAVLAAVFFVQTIHLNQRTLALQVLFELFAPERSLAVVRTRDSFLGTVRAVFGGILLQIVRAAQGARDHFERADSIVTLHVFFSDFGNASPIRTVYELVQTVLHVRFQFADRNNGGTTVRV
jgi:hypothetical protein